MIDLKSQFPNVNPLLLYKWQHAYTTFFDVNRDGFLGKRDFDLLAEIIGESRGKRSYEYITAKMAFPEIWYSLTQMTHKQIHEKITLEDWIDMWSNTENAKWEKAYLDYMFNLFDASGDKLVDQAEYVQVMAYFGVDREEAYDAFDRFAVGKDGSLLMAIDSRQYSELWHEYFHSTDENAMGNYLLGVLNY